MIPATIPATYAAFLVLAQSAHVVSYYRALGHAPTRAVLSLTIDDYANDRRTVLELRMASGPAGRVEFRTLRGYDRARHRWGDYCAPAGDVFFPDRRGQKALIAWCAEQSQALRGYPGATDWSIFRPAPVPVVSHAMAAALTY